jgi:6-phosphogluconolactonase
MRISLGVATVLATILAGCAARQTAPAPTAQGPTPHTFVYVGTAGGDIQIFELDLGLGDLTHRGRQAVGDAPVALAGDHEGHVLVAALARGSTVVSFAVDPKTGALQPRGRAGTGGSDPARATLDASGKYALVTNRGSGNVSVLAIKPDRTLDTAETFASGKGPVGLTVHPGNQFAFVANLRAGTLSQFTFNSGTGRLTPKSDATSGMPWDSGPRQVACHPNGRFTYVLNETNDTISVHAFDDRMASLSHMAFQVISTLPEGVTDKKNRAGDLQMDPRGLYLYASNTGQDSIASFAINPATGGLKLVGHQSTGGKGLEDLAIDPSGKYLVAANQKSRNITIFRLDERTGVPGRLADISVPSAPRALHIARSMPEL